jgi:hypothetical protein
VQVTIIDEDGIKGRSRMADLIKSDYELETPGSDSLWSHTGAANSGASLSGASIPIRDSGRIVTQGGHECLPHFAGCEFGSFAEAETPSLDCRLSDQISLEPSTSFRREMENPCRQDPGGPNEGSSACIRFAVSNVTDDT